MKVYPFTPKILDVCLASIKYSLMNLSLCFALPGMLVDMTHNYGSAFYSCTIGMAIGALFLALVRPAKRRLLCRRRKPKHHEDTHEKKVDPEEAEALDKLKQSTGGPLACSTVDNLVHAQVEAPQEIEEDTRFASATV